MWAIFQGVQSESSARQALFRLREGVERHIWAAPHGIGQIGNGSTSVKSLLASQHKLAKANVRLLQELALDDIELDFQPESLRSWAKMAVRVNLGMIHYRQSILEGLKAEGHQIIDSEEVVNDAVKAAVTETKKENQIAEALAVAAEADTTSSEFEQLQQKKGLSRDPRKKVQDDLESFDGSSFGLLPLEVRTLLLAAAEFSASPPRSHHIASNV